MCATSLGRTQTHFFMPSAVSASPQRGTTSLWEIPERAFLTATRIRGIVSVWPTILQLTVNFSLRVDDLGCNIVHGSQRRVSNRARSKAYESCSRSRYE
jgi:hypothetical protein